VSFVVQTTTTSNPSPSVVAQRPSRTTTTPRLRWNFALPRKTPSPSVSSVYSVVQATTTSNPSPSVVAQRRSRTTITPRLRWNFALPKPTNSFPGSPPHRTTRAQDFPHIASTGLGFASPVAIINPAETQHRQPRRVPRTNGHTRFPLSHSNADTPQRSAQPAVSTHHRKHNHVDSATSIQPRPGRA
jgi:hypothetical protein